jgi:adenosylcobinamide kinase/adenosylcobinamide-phosphate guanylyltransferase
MIALITGGARSGKSTFAEAYAARLGQRGIYIATSQLYDGEMEDRAELHRTRRKESRFPWETREEPYELAALLAELDAADYSCSIACGKLPPAIDNCSVQSRQINAECNDTVQYPTGDAERGGNVQSQSVKASRNETGDSRSVNDGTRGGAVARPVILVDCLTLWLSNWLLRSEEPGEETATVLQRKTDELVAVLVACKSDVLLVTNEVGAGIVPEYPLGRLFRDWAGILNQRVAAVCDQVFLVTAGIPIELKRLVFRFD